MNDTEIIEYYTKLLDAPTLFYIVDKVMDVTFAVKEEVKNGYQGFFMKTEPSPGYIAKTFIAGEIERFDFTQNP